MPYIGEAVFQRVFDLGGTLDSSRTRQLLGPMAEGGAVQASRAVPEYVSFAAPIPLNLSGLNLEVVTEDGAPVTVSARLYEVGALAVTLRFPVRTQSLAELVGYQNMLVRSKGNLVRRADVSAQVLEALKPRLKGAYEEVFEVPVEAEPYSAYCMTEVPGGAETLFRGQRAEIAGLLIGDPAAEKLSAAEIEDTLRYSFSYYRDDLVIADWDAAFLVEPNGKYEDLLYIFEVANLQLLELRKYDRYLDNTLERGYDEYERLSRKPPISTGRAREMVRELSEVRMDLAKVTDEIANTAKFFGDWYVARIYMGLAGKLHISDYHRVVEEKLETLNDLYQSVLAEIDRRQNLFLEVLIVLLIIFEVGMAFVRH